jgi:kynurenine 3-monooxygenase
LYLSTWAKKGYKVSIYERRGDMRRAKVEAGRSINLALSDRGTISIGKSRIGKAIQEISIPMHGRFIHNIDGTTAFQPYGKTRAVINAVFKT